MKSQLIKISRFLGWVFFSIFKQNDNAFKIHSYPGKHWFIGYYDVISIRNNLLYFHEVDILQSRTPKNCKLMALDLETFQVSELATSNAVNWQLGSRLQVCKDDIVFNDCSSGKLVHKIINLMDGMETLCDFPFWLKSKEFNLTFSIDFQRLWAERRGYGYLGTMPSNLKDSLVILDYNGTKMLRTIKIARIVNELHFPEGGYLNHVIANENYSIILTTYNIEKRGKRLVLPVIYNMRENKLTTFSPGNTFSHPTFVGSDCLFYFDGSGYVKYNLTTKNRVYYLRTVKDGHPTFFNENRFLTDTYPDKYSKMSVYEINCGNIIQHLDHINPPKFFGDQRCDLHPRLQEDLLLVDLAFRHGRAIGVKKLNAKT
jgi:hypothetical protein